MALIEWQIHGTEFADSNCNWGCPFHFNGPRAEQCSRALTFVQVERGFYGKTPLDGLRFGIVAEWPGAIHLGQGRFQTIVDERATREQRAALEAISQGRETDPGSLIWQVFSTTVTTILPTLAKPINLAIDLAHGFARLLVPGIVEGEVTIGADQRPGRTPRVRVIQANGQDFGKHVHLAPIHWGTHGEVAT
jgi:hypothetical protein